MSSVTPPSPTNTTLSMLFSNLASPAQLNNVDGAHALANINGTGAGGDGTSAAALYQQAATVAQDNQTPFFDGTNYSTAVPADLMPNAQDFALPINSPDLPDKFLTWSSQAQVAYLAKTANPGPGVAVQLGSGSSTVNVLIAASGLKVYILDNLQKTDIMKMSAADQQGITTSSFWPTLSARIGIYTPTDNGAGQNAVNAINNEESTLNNDYNNAAGRTDSQNGMTQADIQPFLTEVQLLQQEVKSSKVVSPTDLATALQAIVTRYQRAQDFAAQKVINKGGYGPSDKPYAGLVELDTNGTSAGTPNPQIDAGYRSFIQQETQIANVQSAAQKLAQSPVLQTKSLDAPTLIYYFELYATLVGEATISEDTTEIQQLNDLLNTYSQMQNLINTTLSKFGTDQTQKLGIGGVDKEGELTDSQLRVMAMFEDILPAGQLHPLEVFYGLTTRPTLDMIDQDNSKTVDPYKNTSTPYPTNAYLKDQWNSFNTSISNAVSQLNQQSQLKMNNINDETKQKDRQFDLGNNALSKMADMIQSIGRNIA